MIQLFLEIYTVKKYKVGFWKNIGFKNIVKYCFHNQYN